MSHTTQTPDTTSEFGRMIEFRNGPGVWSGRDKFTARHRQHVLVSMIIVAAEPIVTGDLTLVLTP